MVDVRYSHIYHERIVGLFVRFEGLVYSYADTRQVSRFTPSLMSTVGALLAGNARCGLTPDNHRDFYASRYDIPLVAISSTVMDKYIQALAELPVTQITQVHHLYITWHELSVAYAAAVRANGYIDRYRCNLAMRFMKKMHKLGQANGVSANTHLVYFLVAPHYALHLMAWIIDTCHSEGEYMARLKLEGLYPKQLQTLFRHDLAQVYELQVLRNRTYQAVDWTKEKLNRLEPKLAPIAPDVVYNRAARIFASARKAGARQRTYNWRDYWAMRWSHMPVGSVVSQYDEDLALKRELPRDARVKAAWFSANTHAEHEYWLNRKPEIYASTSTKYEWGKVRALYGCDVTSFLHCDFAMGDCEDMLPPYFPVGARANEAYVKDVIEKFNDGVPFCYDFDDFNSQHSTENMKMVLLAWYRVFGSQLSAEQQRSMEWTIQAMGDQYVRYNELGEVVRINGTLLSGWRLTSFMNTVLNRVYLEEADIETHAIYGLHNGDDVFATTPTIYDAIRVTRKAEMIGVRAQLSKMNIGTIGEFLRVDSRAQVKTSSQYLARAVSTATHGRVEAAPANDFRELIRSHMVRAQAIVDRGGVRKYLDIIYDHLVRFTCGIFNQDIGVVKAMRKLDSIQGGFARHGEASGFRVVKKISDESEITEQAFRGIIPGIVDYVRWMTGKLGITFEGRYVKDIYHRAVDALVRKKVRYEIVIETDQMVKVYLGLRGAWKTSAFVVPIAQARSLGFIALNQIRDAGGHPLRIAQESPNPLVMLSALLS